MNSFLQDLKELWDDDRGPGKLLIVGTGVVVVLFINLMILVVSRGRWGIY